jgi:hypothetical protein
MSKLEFKSDQLLKRRQKLRKLKGNDWVKKYEIEKHFNIWVGSDISQVNINFAIADRQPVLDLLEKELQEQIDKLKSMQYEDVYEYWNEKKYPYDLVERRKADRKNNPYWQQLKAIEDVIKDIKIVAKSLERPY